MYKLMFIILLLISTSYAQSDSTKYVYDKEYIWTDNDGYIYQPQSKTKLFSFDGLRAGITYRFGGGIKNDFLYTVSSGLNIKSRVNIGVQTLISLQYSQLYYEVGIKYKLF